MICRCLLLFCIVALSHIDSVAHPVHTPIDTIIYSTDWVGYICLLDESTTKLTLVGEVDQEILIGTGIVQKYSHNRTNPYCHPIRFSAGQKNILYSSQDSLAYVFSEQEIECQLRSSWNLGWYFYFYLGTLIVLFLIGIIATLLFFIYRNHVFLLYAGYIICFTFFLSTTYESFFLFDHIESYTTMASTIDVILSVTGTIFYNHFMLALLNPAPIYHKLFGRTNYILAIGGVICFSLYILVSWETGYNAYNILSFAIIINIAAIIFVALRTSTLISRLVIAGSMSLLLCGFLAVVFLLSQSYYGPNASRHPLFYMLIGFLLEVAFFTTALVLHTRQEWLIDKEINQLKVEPKIVQHEIGNNTIAISTAKSIQYANLQDIIRCEAQGAYCRYHLKGGRKILVSQTLKTQVQTLSDKIFFRCHQSHLINLSEVRMYNRLDQTIEMSDHSIVQLSRTNKEKFIEAMQRI